MRDAQVSAGQPPASPLPQASLVSEPLFPRHTPDHPFAGDATTVPCHPQGAPG